MSRFHQRKCAPASGEEERYCSIHITTLSCPTNIHTREAKLGEMSPATRPETLSYTSTPTPWLGAKCSSGTRTDCAREAPLHVLAVPEKEDRYQGRGSPPFQTRAALQTGRMTLLLGIFRVGTEIRVEESGNR